MDERWDLAALRQRSELLFGSPHRLPVAVITATATEDELFPAAIAGRAGIHRKDAGKILSDWTAADLLEPSSPPGRRRRRGRQPGFLRRHEDEFWSYMQELGKPYRRR